MSLVCLDLPFLFQDLTQDITLLVVVLSLLTLLGWDRVSDFFLFLISSEKLLSVKKDVTVVSDCGASLVA